MYQGHFAPCLRRWRFVKSRENIITHSAWYMTVHVCWIETKKTKTCELFQSINAPTIQNPCSLYSQSSDCKKRLVLQNSSWTVQLNPDKLTYSSRAYPWFRTWFNSSSFFVCLLMIMLISYIHIRWHVASSTTNKRMIIEKSPYTDCSNLTL